MTSFDSIGYAPSAQGVRPAASTSRNAHSSMTNPHLLLIDDDARLTRMVGDYLRTQGFDVDTAGTLADGRMRLAAGSYDALVLDLLLPDGDGLDFTRELRGQPATRRLPLMMLTARGEPTDRIVGLELGADDYLPKPFEPRELLARIHALMRRSSGALATTPGEAAADAPATPRFEPSGVPVTRGFGGWQIDWRNRMLISPEGIGLSLSNVEYRLLAAFAEHPGEVLSRGQLVELTRSAATESNERSIDLAVSRLRAKLRESLENPQFIRTVRGRGYQFTAELAR